MEEQAGETSLKSTQPISRWSSAGGKGLSSFYPNTGSNRALTQKHLVHYVICKYKKKRLKGYNATNINIIPKHPTLLEDRKISINMVFTSHVHHFGQKYPHKGNVM